MLLPTNRLLWVPDARRCPDGTPTSFHDADLYLDFGERTAVLRLPLGLCADAYVAELPLLERVLDETDYTSADVLGFAVEGEPVQAEVWLGGRIGTVPWEAYTAGTAAAAGWLEGPPPTVQELQALPQVREAWALAQATGGTYLDEQGQPTLAQIALLATPTGLVRGVALSDGPADSGALRELSPRAAPRPPAI